MNFRDQYFKAKAGQSLSKVEEETLRVVISGPLSDITYHSILTYGLVSRPSEANLDKLLKLAEEFFERQDDDLLAACLTAGTLYMGEKTVFRRICEEILAETDLDTFQDSLTVAVSCLSSIAMEEKDETILLSLVEAAKQSFGDGNSVRCETLVRAALAAATGHKWIRSEIIDKFFDVEQLESIVFGLKI